MAVVEIEMDDADFQHLVEEGLLWRDGNWEAQADRFVPVGGHDTENPSWDWAAAYWVGTSWTTVVLARSWLKSKGENCEVVIDSATHPNGSFLGFIILTNYEPGLHRG
ncbi:hypothetical protein [Streptomyces luteogriseus]|uniref:hypothetical protein n=1 Tax=Streptomyces luteogriseus TaxID=68233 RepID=UPI0037B8A635